MTTQAINSPKLVMGHPAPPLVVKTLDGGSWNLANQTPQNYTLIVFYRGQHCPICEAYITQLDHKIDAFSALGVDVIAISGDSLEKAIPFQSKTNTQELKIGYGLTVEAMRRWGLYVSQGHFDSEPSVFSEPAVFLVKPDGRLYFANLGTHPFSRVALDLLLKGLAYIIPNNYPFRGTE